MTYPGGFNYTPFLYTPIRLNPAQERQEERGKRQNQEAEAEAKGRGREARGKPPGRPGHINKNFPVDALRAKNKFSIYYPPDPGPEPARNPRSPKEKAVRDPFDLWFCI
jgi:hypothetical protein